MPPNIISGESSGGKHFKLVLEVTPPNVHVVPKVLGLHLPSFTLQGFNTREACRVVSVGQNWRLDCCRSLHSAAELVPGRSIDTVSFCGWAPCHAEAALCEYTSCNIPSSRMGNFFVMSSSSMASQSTLAFATKMGWKPSALIFHFWIRQVTSRAREPLAASFRSKMCGSRTIGFFARQVTLRV